MLVHNRLLRLLDIAPTSLVRGQRVHRLLVVRRGLDGRVRLRLGLLGVDLLLLRLLGVVAVGGLLGGDRVRLLLRGRGLGLGVGGRDGARDAGCAVQAYGAVAVEPDAVDYEGDDEEDAGVGWEDG